MHIWSILISCEEESEVQKGEWSPQRRIRHRVANISQCSWCSVCLLKRAKHAWFCKQAVPPIANVKSEISHISLKEVSVKSLVEASTQLLSIWFWRASKGQLQPWQQKALQLGGNYIAIPNDGKDGKDVSIREPCKQYHEGAPGDSTKQTLIWATLGVWIAGVCRWAT